MRAFLEIALWAVWLLGVIGFLSILVEVPL
jgi:hypothetical protein